MIEIPVTINSDKNGYFDRECPNENCLYKFKVNMEDWKEKVSDDEVHCPLCGHIDSSDNWWTQDQLDAMNNIVVHYIQRELDKSLKKLECNDKYLTITYKPEHRVTFINNPIGQCEEWEQNIQCPKCQTRYSIIGSAFFCPCCGFNVIEDVFDENMDSIVKMVDSLPKIEEIYTEAYGKDKAVSMCRSMLEGSLGDVVSAFQKFAELKYRALSRKDVKVNDFQIIDKGSRLFREACGKGYNCWLSANELKDMNLMFQRRHVYEHNGGIVNEKYIEKSADKSYLIGQRLVIHNGEVKDFITIVKKLADGLKQ